MGPSTRLRLCVGMVMFSLLYGALMAVDFDLAAAIASGYVAVLLTAFILLNVWKRS